MVSENYLLGSAAFILQWCHPVGWVDSSESLGWCHCWMGGGKYAKVTQSGSVPQVLQCRYSKAAKDWIILEEQLFYRRNPWGDAAQSLELRWILDCYEGPSRMRRRIQHANTRATMMRMKSEVESFCRRCTISVTVAGDFMLTSFLYFLSPDSSICCSMHREPTEWVWFWESKRGCNMFSSNRMVFPWYKVSPDRWEYNLTILFCL